MSADAWWEFEQRLSRFLSAMHAGETMILSDQSDDSRYMQFLSFGADGIHAEVLAHQIRQLPATVVGALCDVWQIPVHASVTAVKVTDFGGPQVTDD